VCAGSRGACRARRLLDETLPVRRPRPRRARRGARRRGARGVDPARRRRR
jgi:hypothetical protein